MRRCYISKCYSDKSSGGNKAKTDVESIMSDMDFVNLGLKQSIDQNKIRGFLLTLLGIIKACFMLRKNDILVLQYPLKKYYTFICKITHLKGAKVVTLIHDLGSFRRKKLSPTKEKKRLGNSDYLIALNDYMKKYLVDMGYVQPIGVLGMWDYLSEVYPNENKARSKTPEIIYAGALTHKRHSFIYKLDKTNPPQSYNVTIYGGYFDQDNIDNKDHFHYKGFVDSDDLIKQTNGDYGLVWYGHSVSEIDGVYGEYLQITSAHKPSLYIRCYIPIIAWSKSAQADFIRDNNIGICIDSLDQLDEILPQISEKEYMTMKQNAKNVSLKLESGYYFRQAFLEAEEILKKI